MGVIPMAIEKTLKGYKLFEMNDKGQLFPLFIGKNIETKIGEWLPAEYIPTKGFAARGGWHIGELPDAPWLKGLNGTEYGEYKSRFTKGRRVWCEIEYNATNDYNDYVATLPKKCIVDGVPENGYYFFREVGKGVWSITSDIKVVRVLSEEERKAILAEKGYDEVAAFAKYKETMEKRQRTIASK